MISRKEQVLKAIKGENPDYIPMLYFNKDKERSDLVMIDVARHFMGEKEDTSEWGFVWDRYDETMGQPRKAVLEDWNNFLGYKPPDPLDKGRFAGVRPTMQTFGADRYYIASLVLTGFTVMTFLRGFQQTLEDLYTAPERIAALADTVFGFEESVIRMLPAYGFDAVAFFDDWGMQNNMIISPDLWRSFFKPRYKKLFHLAHSLKLHVYFHCCGYYFDIIGDLIEAGVDILNISQPNLYDIPALGEAFGGKVCFICPVSYQTTSISGTREEIFKDVATLVDHLGVRGGRLLGYIEYYRSIGMSDENYYACIEAFEKKGLSS